MVRLVLAIIAIALAVASQIPVWLAVVCVILLYWRILLIAGVFVLVAIGTSLR